MIGRSTAKLAIAMIGLAMIAAEPVEPEGSFSEGFEGAATYEDNGSPNTWIYEYIRPRFDFNAAEHAQCPELYFRALG